jgi:hypothetical protein
MKSWTAQMNNWMIWMGLGLHCSALAFCHHLRAGQQVNAASTAGRAVLSKTRQRL